MSPLDWPALIAEALRRRKAEGLSQKQHAALAGVSIPTIIAFDRAEHGLSIAKAMDILRVVGLVAPPISAEAAQDRFVEGLVDWWRDLTRDLSPGSSARFRHGAHRLDYWIEGEVKALDLVKFKKSLRQVEKKWNDQPLCSFQTMDDPSAPRKGDWLDYACLWERDYRLRRPGDCDFWRAAPSGRLALLRGYQEDSQDRVPPGTILDPILPIRLIGKALLHATDLARLIARDPATAIIHLRVVYTGLKGRDLRALGQPGTSPPWVAGQCQSDEVILARRVPVIDIDTRLSEHVHAMVHALYERFGVTGLSPVFVSAELDRIRQSGVR